MHNLSSQLIHLRKKLGLTQRELADKVGIDQTMISDYEMGKFIPSQRTINKFAKQGIIIDLDGKVAQIKDYEIEEIPDVSRQLINLRRSLQISQTELAELVGVHKNTIARIERREGFPDPATLQKFVDNKIDLNQYNEDSEMSDIAKQVIKIRENLGLNQGQFARKIGVSQATLCEIESGKRQLTPTTLRKIRDKTGVSLNLNSSLQEEEKIRNEVGHVIFSFNIENEIFELTYSSYRQTKEANIYTLILNQKYFDFIKFLSKKNPSQIRNMEIDNIQKVLLLISSSKTNYFYTLKIIGDTTGIVTFKPSKFEDVIEKSTNNSEDAIITGTPTIPKIEEKKENTSERNFIILCQNIIQIRDLLDETLELAQRVIQPIVDKEKEIVEVKKEPKVIEVIHKAYKQEVGTINYIQIGTVSDKNQVIFNLPLLSESKCKEIQQNHWKIYYSYFIYKTVWTYDNGETKEGELKEFIPNNKIQEIESTDGRGVIGYVEYKSGIVEIVYYDRFVN